ncbi:MULTISPECIES: CBS domain-containing protein [Cetobacterium]|uniref:CBS domain-containing protein n=1 Tax=Cetobacterium TaxID=180162 RepID=UPI00163C57A3|nr:MULTISPECIES: CBS domain-containing protein [Cetobacterium]MBC2854142.1 CBS domain-containing protein [Cetobacterium sp. 2G large]WVJ00591.1 CBS domain-containing protein [Cetobacterium somerae]
MKLSSYLSEKVIIPNIKGNNINELIENLLDQLVENNKSLKNEKAIMKKAVLKREEEASTYLGHGVAIPHARLEHYDDILVAIGFPEKPVMVKTLDNKEEELKIVILVIADVLKGKKILKIMSGISKLAMKNKVILDRIIEEKDPIETIKILEAANIEVDHNITAEDLMTNIPKPVKETNTLEDIAKIIIMEKVSGIPVVDKNNNFLGEITERELISFGMPKYTTILNDLNFMTVGEPFENYLINEKTTTIEELYRREGVVTVDREASLMEVSYLFMNRGVTRIYVVESGKYLGIILRSDIIRKILHI